MLLAFAPAFADQALVATSSTSCGAPYLMDTLPGTGTDGLSPDTVLTLWFSAGPGCGAPAFDATLTDEGGALVPFHVETVAGATVALVPDAPLAAGYYEYVVTTEVETSSVWIGVGGDGLPAPTGLDLRRARLWRDCTYGSTLGGDVRVEGGGEALVQVSTVTDGVAGPWQTVGVTSDATDAWDVWLPVPSGLHELCLDARLLDDTLTPVAEETRCWSSRACPAPPPDGILGFRCAHAPGSTGGAVAAWLVAVTLAAGRRRR